jgi:hypothetical protein
VNALERIFADEAAMSAMKERAKKRNLSLPWFETSVRELVAIFKEALKQENMALIGIYE